MATAGHAPTATEYIVHHLTHLNTSGHAQTKIVDFSLINLDTVFWSVSMAILTGFLLWLAAKRIAAGTPGRFTGAIEALSEFVHEQTRSIVKGDITYIAPLALTVFVWVLFMNALDFFPVDLFDRLFGLIFGAEKAAHMYHRVVPTADLNGTMAMSVMVLLSSLYYGIKVKGAGGFIHELFSAPFGDHWLLYPINFIMQLIEYAAKTVSLGMRLFGNMFAGELVFLLIALLGATFTWWGTAIHLGLGFVWAVFHILIVALQAFIFMMLTLVYLGQAHDHH
jgi:F-type H+-transporting ATPase subunit a